MMLIWFALRVICTYLLYVDLETLGGGHGQRAYTTSRYGLMVNASIFIRLAYTEETTEPKYLKSALQVSGTATIRMVVMTRDLLHDHRYLPYCGTRGLSELAPNIHPEGCGCGIGSERKKSYLCAYIESVFGMTKILWSYSSVG